MGFQNILRNNFGQNLFRRIFAVGLFNLFCLELFVADLKPLESQQWLDTETSPETLCSQREFLNSAELKRSTRTANGRSKLVALKRRPLIRLLNLKPFLWARVLVLLRPRNPDTTPPRMFVSPSPRARLTTDPPLCDLTLPPVLF
jgi:hypothetical protein